MVLAMDETPLMYGPPVKGTYVLDGATKQISIIGSREKRSITGSPVISRSGHCLGFQMLWKGTTDRCHPTRALPGFSSKALHPTQPPHHPAIWFDHTASKMQTRDSFNRLLGQVDRRLPMWRATHGLPRLFPALLVLDNAPAHHGEDLQPLQRGRDLPHLWQSCHFPSIYILFTRANRSHVMNPGDQQVKCNVQPISLSYSPFFHR